MGVALVRSGMMKAAAFGLLGVVALSGCAAREPAALRPLAERQADLYPVAQTRAGVTVAVDALSSPARTEQHFATDLRAAGILPVQVIVSNHGPRRLVLGPADVLLVREQAVIDPLPLETVIDTVRRRAAVPARGREIDEYFVRSALHETGLAPGASTRGLLYFPVPLPPAADRGWYRSVSRWFGEDVFDLRVAVTDADSGERLHFGPLPVAPR